MPILISSTSHLEEDDPGQTVEERISRIVEKFKRLRHTQNQQHSSIERLKLENKALKKDAIKMNERLEHKILAELESLHTDDVLIALFGLIWILIGSAMSTLSPELFQFIK